MQTRHIGFLTPRDLARFEFFTEGPYLASISGLSRIWKLYPDTYNAFVVSTVPIANSFTEYKTLNASSSVASNNLAVAVPSRLYTPPRADRPLNGLRFGVKDNIHLHGIRTAGSSRSYFQLYDPQNASAPAIKRLLELGAVAVGKTGLSQFADAEGPTGDYVDYHCPFNPRGDGYRSPGGSSSGSGAAAGAYDWLDFTIGTDTGGSVRSPAAHQGVFGIRPSSGMMTVEGSLIIHRDLDAIGVISRDVSNLQHVSRHLYRWSSHMIPSENVAASDKPSKPKRLLYPLHLFPVENRLAQSKYDEVFEIAEKTLGLKRQDVDFRIIWKDFSKTFTKKPYDEYFYSVMYDYIVWGQYQERAQFRQDYTMKFGHEPYVNPLAQFRHIQGATMTQEYFDTIQEKRKLYEKFIVEVFGADTIMLTPFMFGEPEPRHMYRLPPSERDPTDNAMGLRPAFQTPFSGQPEAVFPVGQLNVTSSITKGEQSYAIIASCIGSKGMDPTILRAIQDILSAGGLSHQVQTGPVPYPREIKPCCT